MFNLVATTFLRRSELVSLTWEQIGLINETIRINGKGKKERVIAPSSTLNSASGIL
ncbi:tyrosine-type recombinase/integrase [Lysinibacillus agricola]|uniref:tyrosine-type recombinase/integrase n=1 Tax=Lysinibacillus agricola TaxID=2590012 RepID=UPI003C133143